MLQAGSSSAALRWRYARRASNGKMGYRALNHRLRTSSGASCACGCAAHAHAPHPHGGRAGANDKRLSHHSRFFRLHWHATPHLFLLAQVLHVRAAVAARISGETWCGRYSPRWRHQSERWTNNGRVSTRKMLCGSVRGISGAHRAAATSFCTRISASRRAISATAHVIVCMFGLVSRV